MLILDTSIWVEFLRAHVPFYELAKTKLENGEVIGLPWIFGELLQGVHGAAESRTILSFWKAIPKPELSLCEGAWLRAGEASSRGKWFAKGVGLIDAAIICAAEELNAKVWTLDKKLEDMLKFKKLLFKQGVGVVRT
jgi:predicted nucleic acid-binding protein